MSAPVVVFSLVSAALWVLSLFFRRQARCTRCTGGMPHFGSFLTGSSGLCRKCREPAGGSAPVWGPCARSAGT